MRKAVAFHLIVGAFLLLGATGAFAQWSTSGSNVFLTNSSNLVGVGTSTPVTKFDVGGWNGIPGGVVGALANVGGDFFMGNVGTNVGRFRMSSNANQGFMQWNMFYNGAGYKSEDSTKPSYEINMQGGGGLDLIQFNRYAPSSGSLVPTTLMAITSTGVGIGTSGPAAALDVVGNINVSGNINAKFQDVAEWVPASTKIAPGTVVVLNQEKNNEVMPSHGAYDTTVAGVVSVKPGILLGEPSPTNVQVATSGRVLVKVDATKGPIRIGDLLVTGDKPGMAMKSVPVDLGGIKMHRPGTLIGKALQPLDKGEGEILVLLSLQ